MFGRRFRQRDNRAKQHRAKHPNTDQLRPDYRRRLRLEPLEDRRVLSGILHVDADATGSMTGLSWPDAFDDLQAALSAARTLNRDADPSNDITAIWIAEGTYKPTAQLEADDVRTATFSLVPDVDLIGGFAGNETTPDQRPLLDGEFQHPTILSGDLGVIDDKADNAYTVVYGDLPAGTETTIDGLTITAARKADMSYSGQPAYHLNGGGIYATGSGALTIMRATLSGNVAHGGGGVYSRTSMLIVANSIVSGNSAYNGGGIHGKVTVTNSTISGNSADYEGGGIYNPGYQITVNNTIVAMNEGGWETERNISGNWTGTANLIEFDPWFVRNPSRGTDDVWGTEDDDYGDLRLLRVSPAINQGSNALAVDSKGIPLETDRAGVNRIVDGTVDIGAYEYQSRPDGEYETPSNVVTSLSDLADSSDGAITLREACAYARLDWVPAEITFMPSLFTDGPAIIALQRGQIEIRNDLTVTGPGAELLTLDGGNQSRVFFINDTEANVAITGLEVTGGSATWGGGIYSKGILTVAESTFLQNSASSLGGAIFGSEGLLTIINTIFSDNSARGGGAVNFRNGTLVIADATFFRNSANAFGGAIESTAATVKVMRSTFSGNSVSGWGGGIYIDFGTLIIANSTFSGNSATAKNYIVSGDGGAIASSSGTTMVTNSTFSGNAADGWGHAISCDRKTATVKLIMHNTIVALNEVGGRGRDIDCEWKGTANLIGFDPKFVRKPSRGTDGLWGTKDDDYGDLRLTSGSLAINQGSNALAVDAEDIPLETDRDGATRIVDGTIDVGAFEYQRALSIERETPSNVVTSLSDVIDTYDGQTTLREACAYAAFGLAPAEITFAPSLFTAGPAILALQQGEFAVYDDVTIIGPGDDLLTLDAGDQSRVFYIDGTDANVTLAGLTITGGSAYSGGAICNYSSTLTITDSTLADNSVEGPGGAVLNSSGILTIANSSLSRNSAKSSGGGVYSNGGTLTVINSTIFENATDHFGGGIASDRGTVVVTSSTLSGNWAQARGGGICSYAGRMVVTDSTLSDNSANNGGGIHNSGTLTIRNSTIARNSATDKGGGIYDYSSSRTRLTVVQSTFSENSARTGGGMFAEHFVLTILDNTLVAQNEALFFPDLFSAQLAGSHNLIGDGAGCQSWLFDGGLFNGVDGNLVGTQASPIDPWLSDWTQFDNGRWGYFLLPRSPAIGAGQDALAVDGDGNALVTDCAGNPRTSGARVDIGASEFQFGSEPFVIDRQIIYRGSRLAAQGNGAAMATDKWALLPGEFATFENYTSYVHGINGIVLDLFGTVAVTEDDIQFRIGNGDDLSIWEDAPAPDAITMQAGEGIDDSDQVVITWSNGAITNTWLQVTILANENTGLAEPDVFYFGNAVGETGNSWANAMVTAADELLTRNNRRGLADRATIEDPYDFNRDGLVNAADRIVARNNRTGFGDALKLITPGASELLENGGFETGDFTGWTATSNGCRELTPWTVGPAGGGFLFDSQPLEGNYSAYNGFDGQAGLVYELKQTVDMPSTEDLLAAESWLVVNYRVVTAFGTKNALGRKVEVLVRDENGDLLDTLYSWEITPQPGKKVDLGWNRVALRMPDYFGQTIEICLREEIPETNTGPGLIEWDDLSLTVIAAP